VFEKIVRGVPRLCVQELRFEVHPREVCLAPGPSPSRFELDKFIYMAEHIAVRGLDDAALPEPAHYWPALPDNNLDEPFLGFCSPQGTPMRRVECTVQAHNAARMRLLDEIAVLRAMEVVPEMEIRDLEWKLQRIGDVPSCMVQNDADNWTKKWECVSQPP
jgi:hypothetical protein